jgi:hypothetical protein
MACAWLSVTGTACIDVAKMSATDAATVRIMLCLVIVNQLLMAAKIMLFS